MRAFTMAIAGWVLGCAGASSNVRATEFEPGDTALFDDAVDLVDTPVIVESEWRGEFERRVERADLIAVIKVESLSSDQDLRRSAYRLAVKVIERLKGESGKELVLRAHDDEPGFQTVRVNEDRLLRDRFVAFVKWQADEDSDVLFPRWHLSPDSEAVREKIAFLLRPPPTDPLTKVEVVEP